MFLTLPRKKKRNKLSLLGAVRINSSSFFVYKNQEGNISLKSGKEEKVQKAFVESMIEQNPRVKNILNTYKIKPNIDTKTLKELAGGHMNETCKVAMGIYTALSKNLNIDIDENTIKEACMLHDLGKVLIPSKILNKPARLNIKEREIMPLPATCIDLAMIIVIAGSQIEKDK